MSDDGEDHDHTRDPYGLKNSERIGCLEVVMACLTLLLITLFVVGVFVGWWSP